MSLLEQSIIRQSTKETIRKLTLPQDEFIFSTDEFICIKGTFGCGKSLAGLIAACIECETHPNNLYIVIRKEYIDLKNSTMRDWENEFGEKYPIKDNQVKFPNRSTLIFLHGEDINSIKNINAGGVLIVQAEEMREDDFWFLKGRLRRQQGTRRLRLECNYDGHNWIYRLFNEQKMADGTSFKGGRLIMTNTFDNATNLPSDYIPGLMKLPKKLQERYLYGSDADMEGAVWDEFKERHIIQPFYLPTGWEQIVCLDHGFTNPTAVLWAACDWDGKIYIFDEHYESSKSISYHADRIKERDNSSVKKYLIDPSCSARTQQKKYADGRVDLHSIIDEYKDYGIQFEPADNELLGGLNRVNELFKQDRLFIFKNCVNTIRECQNYKWKRMSLRNEENTPEEPVNKDDHTCAGLRYIVNSRPPISKIIEQPIDPNSPYGRLKKAQRINTEEYLYG